MKVKLDRTHVLYISVHVQWYKVIKLLITQNWRQLNYAHSSRLQFTVRLRSQIVTYTVQNFS